MKLLYQGNIYESYSNENKYLIDYMKDPSPDYGHIDVSDIYRDWLEENHPTEYRTFSEENPDYFDAFDFNVKYPDIKEEFEDSGTLSVDTSRRIFNSGYTKAHMDLNKNKQIPRQTWLVHFSNNADDIARLGFKYGEQDISDIALTTYKSNSRRKLEKGYNFAFEALSKYALAAEGDRKYGNDAVLFQSSGVDTFHYGDEEKQIVFWGDNVKEFVLLNRTSNGWSVIRTNSREPLITKEEYDELVKWVINNYSQYKNKILWRVK